ncbi:TonB-dependent receptor [Solilutibacter silvestris]|uniref:Carboxypeptidase regulatory-like domain n=1 Tax=Solilutibacter silvestris TaxID=1645665 RepID=A0A2K1PZY0_9GAMM|nr:TonB-dependent receptor [Lysobacter silvestris]PNS08217.1 Carboxypeptidase regulatory-like domain [Lysobacter silvestris]
MKNEHRSSHSRLQRSLLAVALCSCIAAMSTPAFAQSSNATLRGKAPPGAQITATNTASGATRKVSANADGSYALVGLEPGTYRVEAAGGAAQTVTLAVATSVNLNLAGGAAAATTGELGKVTVTGALVEKKTSEVGKNISLKQINTVPQLTRNFLEFADTVPGMQFTTDGSGHSDIRGGAQQTSAVNVYIDGVGQKSYLFGGVSGQQQSAGNPFPQLAIGEYKVVTSNYKAEFDQVGSAAIIAQTKSGGNQFHGEVFGRHTNTSWRDRTAAEQEPGKDKLKTRQNEYGFALGGPIIKDKMHFFVSYEGKNFVTPADPVTVPSQFASYAPYLPQRVQQQFGPVTRPFKEDLYFGKIDWEIGDNDKLEFSAKVRKEDSRDSVGAQTTARAAKNNANRENRYDLRWEHYGESFLNEARVTYEDVLFNPTAYNFGNQSVYTKQQSESDVLMFDDATSGLAIQRKGQKGPAFQDDLTFNRIDWHGSHVIKVGFKYKQVDLTQSENSTVNPSFYYMVNDGSAPGPTGTSAIPYEVKFNLPFVGGTPSVTTKDKQYGFYIQDDWDVTDRLQFNLGVRWDYEKIPSYTNFVTPSEVLAALNGPDTTSGAPAGQTYRQTLAKGGINIDNYIGNGHNRKSPKNNWAPRLGFSYDISGDESLVLFGGAGRSYDRNLYDYMGLEQVKSALSSYTVKFAESTGCTPAPNTCANWNPGYLSGGSAGMAGLVTPGVRNGEIDLLNNNMKTPYSDQYSLGLRAKLGEWNTSATLSKIISKNGFVFTLGNRYPNGAFWGTPSWGGTAQPWEHNPPGFGGLILGDNGIETRTAQLLLSADKPYTKSSGWGASVAYTFSHASGNRGGDEHYSFDAATIGNYPFIPLKAVPVHRLVVTGIYDLPWGITSSGKLTLSTPPPRNEVADGWSGSGNIPTPLAFDVPGAYGVKELDLSLSKDIKIYKGLTVQFRGDLINAFNWGNRNDYTWTWVNGQATNIQVKKYGSQYTPPRTLFMSMRVFF